jgi:hypothetical protein
LFELTQDVSRGWVSNVHLVPLYSPRGKTGKIELLRQAPAWRKLEMVGQMNQTLRTLALSGLRQRHPSATQDELRRRLADLLLGLALAAQVYGPLRPSKQE